MGDVGVANAGEREGGRGGYLDLKRLLMDIEGFLSHAACDMPNEGDTFAHGDQGGPGSSEGGGGGGGHDDWGKLAEGGGGRGG